MKLTFAMTSLAFGATLLAPTSGLAQSRNCGQHDTIVERLADRYGESRQVIALGSNNSVIEVFASAETGTWTITVTNPGGPTCLVAAGEHYQQVAEALPSSDNGA